ncbi:MAG: adenylate/guanylate cyclase domain-containing protein [Syntrophobacteraceae bacterium]|nr:adenylate/guanylate cyclase domain-containing protein [Syntrophobacteraceae bacterium]
MPKPSPSSISDPGHARITVLWIVISFLGAHLLFLIFPRVFTTWNDQLFDRFFILRSSFPSLQPPYDQTVVHVDITNSTMERMGNFYLNRAHFARLMENLASMNSFAQAYDFIFPARTNAEDDELLLAATARSGNAYFGVAFVLDSMGKKAESAWGKSQGTATLERTRWRLRIEGDPSGLYRGSDPLSTFPDLALRSRGLGFLNVTADPDGVFRRVPLVVKFEDGFYPSLPFRVACDYLDVGPDRITLSPGRHILLAGARHPRGEDRRDIRIPIDARGNLRINYVGPWERMKHYNFAAIYKASEDRDELVLWKEELSGKIVLISDVATGSADQGPVPTDANLPLSGLHANVLNTILAEAFLRELTFSEGILLDATLAGCILLLATLFSSYAFPMLCLALALGVAGTALASFLYLHTLIPLLRPLLAILFSAGNITGVRYIRVSREKAVLRRLFEAYFPPSVVGKLVARPEVIESGGQRKELTILFSDIQGFTTHSSRQSPEEIRRALNEYFDAMVEIVFRYDGTVDKYMGDGLMVFFGDPNPQEDHALRAVRAAVEMQKRVRELDAAWARDGGMPLKIRIGINTGEVVVGNMGSKRRLSYTVLGSAVNLAQRLESNAPVGGILVSERTHTLVQGHVPSRSRGLIRVKGLETPVQVYEVLVDP